MCNSCSCNTTTNTTTPTQDGQDRQTFEVVGMTCGHCVASVTEEVNEIAGVTDVQIDLATGRLDIASDGSVSRESVEAAVREAGYTLV